MGDTKTQSEMSKALHGRKFQMQGALFAMRHKHVLIADEPGLGKTLESIAAVVGNKISGSILVVAPKTAVYVTWPAELERWLGDVAPNDVVRILGGQLTRRERYRLVRKILEWDMAHEATPGNPPWRQWVVVSPNYLRFSIELDDHGNFVYNDEGEKIIRPVNEALPALLAIQWATVIVDEAHQTLAGATGNIKTQSAQSRGLRLLEIEPDGLRIALSGTPFRGKHENLWGILNWLQPRRYGPGGGLAYWDWIKKHFELYIDFAWGGEAIGELKSERALAEEVSSLMIRRTKKQVAPELPAKRPGGTPLFKNGPIAVWLPMNGEQRKAYEQMKKEAIADIEGGQLIANGILAEIIRLKQFANSYGKLGTDDVFYPSFPSNKFDWLLEFFSERGILDGNGTGKVVVASQFTKHIKLFAAELRERYKVNVFVLTGETSERDRVRMQREFQSGSTEDGNPSADVFLLNTHAGGVSLTLDAADDIVLVDSTKNPDDQTQVIDRVHRISRIHQVTVWNLASKNSIDEHILRETHRTGKSLKRILDHGGIQAVRELIGG